MMFLAIKSLLIAIIYYAVLLPMFRRSAHSATYPYSQRRVNRDSNNSDEGEGTWPKDFPKLDLPPGVYILPPGAPDPSQRKERIR